jgi:hypothetical protein
VKRSKGSKRDKKGKKGKKFFLLLFALLAPSRFPFVYGAEPFARPPSQAGFFCRSFVPVDGKSLKLLTPGCGLNIEEPQYPKGIIP